MSIVVERVEFPTDDARLLIGELDAELNGSYAPDQRHGLSIDRVFRPGIFFFVARLNHEPVGCGGVEFMDGLAEVKRMYVRPHMRGKKVADAILDRLIEEAGSRRVKRVALETGDAQHAAIRFYERAGFARCGAFGEYTSMAPAAVERSVFFHKHLQ